MSWKVNSHLIVNKKIKYSLTLYSICFGCSEKCECFFKDCVGQMKQGVQSLTVHIIQFLFPNFNLSAGKSGHNLLIWSSSVAGSCFGNYMIEWQIQSSEKLWMKVLVSLTNLSWIKLIKCQLQSSCFTTKCYC